MTAGVRPPRLETCPPCGAESLLPLCRAVAIGVWSPSTEDTDGNLKGEAEHDCSGSRIDEIFSTRRPRDFIAGAASGLKTCGRSLAAGLASFYLSPIEGSKSNGAKGLALGLRDGTCSAVLLPATGVIIGIVQVVRGLANTPVAVAESFKGLEWNQEQRCWQVPCYRLDEEASRLLTTVADEEEDEAADGKASRRQGRTCYPRPKRVTTVQRFSGPPAFYKLLQVGASASEQELRHAYYRESRRCHPDKVGGSDPHAVARFQKLTEAYKVLKNPELRRAYDAGGQDAVIRVASTVDLGSLYAAVLSSSLWEPFIGDLALTGILASDPDPRHASRRGFEALKGMWCADASVSFCSSQAAREVRLALALAARLQPYTTEEEPALFQSRAEDAGATASPVSSESVVAAWRQEAASLARAPFSAGLLKAVAAVYRSESTRFLAALPAFDLSYELERAREQGRLLAMQAKAVSSGAAAMMAIQKLLLDGDGDEKKDDEGPMGTTQTDQDHPRASSLCLEKASVQENLPLLAKALWSLTVLDIEGTLRRVCRRLLRDSSVHLDTRIRRAEALSLLASIFTEAADAARPGEPGEDPALLSEQVRDAASRLVANFGREVPAETAPIYGRRPPSP